MSSRSRKSYRKEAVILKEKWIPHRSAADLNNRRTIRLGMDSLLNPTRTLKLSLLGEKNVPNSCLQKFREVLRCIRLVE